MVISPHLDDAVFSCGTLIAACALAGPVLVVTVCAGAPPEGTLTSLDEQAGFQTSAEAVRARRREDEQAVRQLGARVLHLDVLDGQYDDSGDRPRRITAALRPVLADDSTLLGPVGVRHDDHRHVAQACRKLGVDLVYADLPSRVLWPECVPALDGPPCLELPASAAKRLAVRCYASQIGDGEPGDELDADERYYRPSQVGPLP